MLGYIEYLKTPTGIATILIAVFLIIQVIGEVLEFKGKVVPEFVKVRKYFDRKKKEKMAFNKMVILLDKYEEMSKTVSSVNALLSEINSHYSKDNITKRDKWMEEVNNHITDSDKKREKQESLIKELNSKLDRNNADTLNLLIDSKRNKIIDFASYVIEEKNPVTREQFKRIFKLYQEYEVIIKTNNLTNGEVDIAYRIITEAYENHMKNHSFIEDIRGYDFKN